MYPRKPLSHADQINLMRRLLRHLHTLLNQRYKHLFEATRKRRECPFEVSLLRRLVDSTQEAVGLAEACLQELRRQEALFYAPFKPGDCVRLESELARGGKKVVTMLIAGLTPGKRSGDFWYEVHDLTKAGAVSKRGWTHSLDPQRCLKRVEPRLNEEAARYAEFYREAAKTSRVLAFERGDLTMFEPSPGYLGTVGYRRVEKTSV
jgi:hypothetical protein